MKTHGSSASVTSSLDKSDAHGGYTPSIVSAVDSQLSSPYTPLLPSPSSPSHHDRVPVPPTTNDLSEAEKMKLMRKVRKLSRVLGEVPVPAVVEEELSHPEVRDGEFARDLHMVSSPLSSEGMSKMRSASAKKAFRRSLTFGQNSTLLDVHDVRHARSLSALRPSLSIPRSPTPSDIVGAPSSPITFARPESVASNRDVSECGLSTSAPEARNADFHALRRRDSTASSVLLADQNVERMQRTRAAKLSRHFGTSIPPEVLFRASSPTPPPASAPAVEPPHILSSDRLPTRSASLRHKPAASRRPASLDILLPTPGLFTQPNSPGPLHVPTNGPSSLKRSKSLWTKRPKTTDGNENMTIQDQDLESGGSGLTEKQRMLNVKRAKKMAQVCVLPRHQMILLGIDLCFSHSINDLQLFGDNPPTALFQITNIPGGAEVGGARNGPDGHRYERDSLATIISISTTSLSPPLSAVKLRDSFMSAVTTSSDVSGLLLAEESFEDGERTTVSQGQDIIVQTSVGSVPIMSPIPLAGRKATHSTSVPNSSGLERLVTNQVYLPSSPFSQPPAVPQTPPPFSNFIPALESRPATAPPASPVPSEFQARRRRAAKLSKFFGVEVNELADALPTEVVPTRKASVASEGGVTFDDMTLTYHQPAPASLVVAEAKRRRVLGMDSVDDVEERDMSEVIDRLRRMRSC